MEALKMPMEKEGKGEEFELSLELSIGGRYGTKSEGKTRDSCVHNQTEVDFSLGSDPQKKREIQAMRRQEARKKRGERLRKSRGAGFVEDKLFLEARKFQTRVQDREAREREGISEGSLGRKAGNEETRLYPKVQHGYAGGCDSKQSNGMVNGYPNRNGSSERSTSPASDYQSTSQKGGSSSDTGSQSSRQHNNRPIRAALNQPQVIHSCSQIESEQNTKLPNTPIVPQPSWSKFVEKSNSLQTSDTRSAPAASSSSTLKETGSSTVKPVNHNANAAPPVPQMPCVSATGNGPSGKTITGFLYKYTNNEVSIMCVCHGSSFSPAEFVEHAGGVNISNPLRHITVIPSSLGCS